MEIFFLILDIPLHPIPIIMILPVNSLLLFGIISDTYLLSDSVQVSVSQLYQPVYSIRSKGQSLRIFVVKLVAKLICIYIFEVIAQNLLRYYSLRIPTSIRF